MSQQIQQANWFNILTSPEFLTTRIQIQQAQLDHRKEQIKQLRDASDAVGFTAFEYQTLAGIPATPFFALDEVDNINIAIVRITNPRIISLINPSNNQQPISSSITIKLIDLWSLLCKHYQFSPAVGYEPSPKLLEAFNVNQIQSHVALSTLLSHHIEIIHGKAISQFEAEFEAVERSLPDPGFLMNREVSASPLPDDDRDDDDASVDVAVEVDTPAVTQSGRKNRVAVHRASPELEKLIGYRYLKRGSAIRLLWNYCKSHGLPSQDNSKVVECNEKITDLFGSDIKTISFIQLLSLITPLLTPVPNTSPQYEDAVSEAAAAADMLTSKFPNKGSRRASATKRKAVIATAIEDDDEVPVARKSTPKRVRNNVDQPARKRRATPSKEIERPTQDVAMSEPDADMTESDPATETDNDDSNEDDS